MATATTSTAIAGPSSIPLYLINGVATIWDAQTAATLHCEHEISGLRVGTLPGVTQQNGFLGLPMTLMQEETAYLVRKAHLVPLKSTSTLPSSDEISRQRNSRIERFQNLERIAREEANRNAQAAREMFIKGGDKAKAKREERARAKAGKGAIAGAEEESLFTPEKPEKGDQESKSDDPTTITPTTKITSRPNATNHKPNKPQSTTTGYFHTIPSQPSSLETISNQSTTIIPFPLFQFPSNQQQSANLKTFQKLSLLSYRMGLGPRFGGEYLIYPGDYLRYHAHFTSQVICGEQVIRPMEIVAWGRLGTGTKKAGLICCVPDPSDGEEDGSGEKVKEEGVEFYSLEWANFG